MSASSAGTQILSADGIVGASGRPTRIMAIHKAIGGSNNYFTYNGTDDASGIVYFGFRFTGSGTKDFGYDGCFHPNGCYLNVGGNTLLVTYVQS